MEGLNAMLENGLWFIHNNPLILKKWHMNVNLLEEAIGTVLVWVKLHGIPVTAFSEDGLSVIATKLAIMPKINGVGYYTCNIHVEYEWKPPRCAYFKNAKSSCLSTTPTNEKINKMENLIINGKAILVNNEGKPLRKFDEDSEDEVALDDNEMASFFAKKDGYGTKSLFEKWKDSHELDDYGYDPYDDEMYKGQEIPEMLQTFCNNLDIKVRGRKKK
uniref:Uncharacterized protein n=1 Tax=Tanacetum cinerariifolium TaxID=118510 RepID=A0A699L570_TANCI|nr:hypothetical protein [Tanacetum cinerariifolium]